MNLQRLNKIADDLGIRILDTECGECRGLATRVPSGRFYIGIDPSIVSEEERAPLLAHEIAHCLTLTFYNYKTATKKEIDEAEEIANRIASVLMDL